VGPANLVQWFNLVAPL